MPSAKADGLILRPARAEELPALTGLCLHAKADWGYDADFMAACRDELTLTHRDLTETCLRVAERAGRVVGVAQLADSAIDKLFVAPEAMGSGVGRALFDDMLRAAGAGGLTSVEIVADPNALAFYERTGAVRTGEVRSESIPRRMLPLLTLKIR